MTMFEVIMHMPVRNAAVHRILCTCLIDNLDDLVDHLNQTDFLVVDEWYPDEQTGQLKNHGAVALNRRHIGKIKEWKR
jgi:hypothetical protein